MIAKTMALMATSCFIGLGWAHTELNRASEIDLDGLKGVGPALTRQVLAEREKTPFKDWADVLERVRGLGPKKALQLSEQGLRVQGAPYPAPSPSMERVPQDAAAR
ncbi:MAG: ComEA family DNA-binding protein [Limnohabitans sp.]